MDVIKVWVPLREYLSVQALYDAAIALHWKISERQNSTHLAFLKQQNTKTSLYKLSKHRKNCECCPGHYLTVSPKPSMSGFKFLNLSGTVNCVTNLLNY